MRFALGTLATAFLVFLSAAVGMLGSWGLAVGAVTMLFGAIGVVIAMEARDLHREARLLERVT